jgi:hypothetical protein
MEHLQAVTERRRARPPRERVTTLLVLVAVWAAGCVVLAAVVLQRSVPAEDLLIDPTRLDGTAWYYGLVKSVGVLAWSVAVCGAVATAFVAGVAGRSAAVRAFRGGALVFAVLLATDLFGLHNAVFPGVLGVDKRAVVVGYGVLAGLWVVGSWSELRRTRWELLVATAVGLGLSALVDGLVEGPESGLRLLAEDGAKFLGVLALAAWSVMTARDVIRSVVGAPVAPPAVAAGVPARR